MDLKKNYVAPSIEVLEVEFESLMTTASAETGGAGTGSGSADGGPELANDRRRGWGDLWN